MLFRSPRSPPHPNKLHIFLILLHPTEESARYVITRGTRNYLRKLGEIVHNYLNIEICLVWLPRSAPLIGFERAKQLALEAIRLADLTEIGEPHTIEN